MHIAIIGGGAAGFFAAIRVKERLPHASVDIYERAQKVLAKVAITGGGRCNLTNSFREVTDLKQVYPRGSQSVPCVHLYAQSLGSVGQTAHDAHGIL